MLSLALGALRSSLVSTTGIPALALASAVVFLAPAPVKAQETAAVYTAAQAAEGQTLYAETCARCHGTDLADGSAPPLTGPTFRRTWSRPNVNVADLLYVMETTMPPRRAGMLSREEHVSILSYIMSRNGLRAGSDPLVPDASRLAAISLLSEEDAEAGAAEAFIQGERARPLGTGPSASDLLGASEDDANWLYHTRDYSGTRYSPLDQVTVENV
ncbi:MAG TPA: c-type cytochrome, partial [Longimicrobiales bacterium]|nr:c-type cytochrome [Longimicrobiales bacterium]